MFILHCYHWKRNAFRMISPSQDNFQYSINFCKKRISLHHTTQNRHVVDHLNKYKHFTCNSPKDEGYVYENAFKNNFMNIFLWKLIIGIGKIYFFHIQSRLFGHFYLQDIKHLLKLVNIFPRNFVSCFLP